jgi:hypothetical protein
VSSTAAHMASFARFVVRRGERERADAAAMSELAARPLPLPRGLELEWLGTAGYRLTYEGRTLLIDPYLTRVPLSAVLRRTTVRADPALHARFLPAAHRNVAGSSSGTPTSTTRSTCRSSRARSRQTPTAPAR